jgi:5-methylcytosine-specific restriction endonuclease McrA
MSAGRNTARRDTHRAAIAKDQPPCHWCGGEILYNEDHLHPFSFQVDHVTPLSKALPGQDLDTLDNCVPSHRVCNRAKSNKVDYQPGVTYVTERRWWTDHTSPEASHAMPSM